MKGILSYKIEQLFSLFDHSTDMVILSSVENGSSFKYVKMNGQALKTDSFSSSVYGKAIEEGNVIRINRAFEDFYRWNKEEVVGKILPYHSQ